MFRYVCALLVVSMFALPSVAQQAAKSFGIPATDDGLAGDGPIRRYDWFKNLWQNKRSGWSNQVEQDQGALVFLGDSITQGWGPKMGNAFPGVKVANRGISGDTTRGMLIRLEEDVLALNPSGIVMLMGTNDLEEGAPPNVIASNLELIIAALKAHNDKMPIILCNVFPSSASKKRSADDIKQINELYAAAVKGDAQVTIVDTWTLFANQEGDAKKAEFPDLLHPNKAGYKKWAAALRPILATRGFLEQDADDFQLEPGFVSLFNGEDLDGWMYRPSTEQEKTQSANWRKNDPNAPPWPIVAQPQKFDNRTTTDDGRYIAKNGRLVVTTPPEGRKIQQFWTQQVFPSDFVLKLEFRATPNADSGVFLRGKQLQCRDYSLAGPYKELKAYKPQEWNELVVVVQGQSAYCTCNGEVIEEAFKIPANGPIGLEGDRGQIEYRRIRIKEIRAELPNSTPEKQGVSSAAVLNFVEALDKLDSVHSFMLLRHGTVIADGWWAPFERDDPHQLYSLSKSFASTAVGLAIDEGHLSLDDLVISFFPEDLPDEVSNHLSSMRIRDLLTMSTGHDSEDLRKFSFQSEAALTKEFLALPVAHIPGTHFLYNTPATYMCSAIVQKVTGQKLVDYLRPRLFEPLEIEDATWSESAQGIAHGGFGLNIKTEDIARFGQLFLQKGEWEGRQLLPAHWVEMATARQVSNGSDPNSDWNQGYGFQFWRCRHNCYRGDGAFGQYCIVMPEHNAVLAMTSGSGNMGEVMQQVWNHVLPGFHEEALPGNPKMVAALTTKIDSLTLPTLQGEWSQRGAKIIDGKSYAFPENEPGLRSIRFEFGTNSFVLLEDLDGTHRIPVGRDDWFRARVPNVGCLFDRLPNASSIGIATHGAWSDKDTFQLRTWMYESPYRADAKFRFDGDVVHVEVQRNVGFGKKSFELKGLVD